MKEKKLRKGRKGKKIIIAVIVIVLVVAGLWACSQSGGAQLNLVETATLEYGDVEEVVSLSGIVESEELKTYFAPVNGTLTAVNVEAGDVVKAGDVLMEYDLEELEEVLEQARLQYALENSSYEESLADHTDALAKLKEANINIAVLEQQIKDEKAYIKNMYNALEVLQTNKSNSLVERTRQLQSQLAELMEDPVGNAEKIKEVEKALRDLEYESQIIATTGDAVELEKKIEEEEERLAGYEKYLAEMEAQKQEATMGELSDYQKDNLTVTQQLNLMAYENAQEDYATAVDGVTAEFDGIITEMSATSGMPVMEGTQLLTLANANAIKVTLTIGKYDLARIAVGQTADVEIGEHVYTGTITKINQMATLSMSGTTQLGAQVHIDNPDEHIYLGLDAKVKVHAAKAEGVLLLPIAALYADKTGDFVYVEENGIVVRKDIVTGISTTEHIEVKEGLSTEDKVIVFSMVTLEEGMTVMTQAQTGEKVEQ